MPERNYDFAGASESSGEVWATIDARLGEAPKFRIGKRGEPGTETFTTLRGYLDGVDLRWSDGKPEENIAPGWEFVLRMSVPDAKRGEGEPPIAKYRVPVRCNSDSICPAVLNVLSAMDPLQWDGYLEMYLNRKEGKPAKVYIKVDKNAPNGTFPPEKYPFDANEQCNVGVPKATLVFDQEGNAIMEGGKQKRNYTAPRNFWLGVAKEMYARYNGTPYTGNIGPSGSAGYKPGEPWGIAKPEQQSAATAQATPSQTPSTAPQSDLASKNEQFYAGLKKKLDTIQDPLLAKTALEIELAGIVKKTKLETWGTNEAELRKFMLDHYIVLTGDNTATWLPAGVIQVTIPSGNSDLPF